MAAFGSSKTQWVGKSKNDFWKIAQVWHKSWNDEYDFIIYSKSCGPCEFLLNYPNFRIGSSYERPGQNIKRHGLKNVLLFSGQMI